MLISRRRNLNTYVIFLLIAIVVIFGLTLFLLQAPLHQSVKQQSAAIRQQQQRQQKHQKNQQQRKQIQKLEEMAQQFNSEETPQQQQQEEEQELKKNKHNNNNHDADEDDRNTDNDNNNPSSPYASYRPSQDEEWFTETNYLSLEERKIRWSERVLLEQYNNNNNNNKNNNDENDDNAAASVSKKHSSSSSSSSSNRHHQHHDRNDERACDPLPSNVSIKIDDNIVLGPVSITKMPLWREQKLRKELLIKTTKTKKNLKSSSPADVAVSQLKNKKCKSAFVLMVSNHRYVDGAIVMAETLWNTSSKLRQKTFCLLMLTSEKLHINSIRQLSLFFDEVRAMRTLGTFTPKSYYAPTFDKAYLWSLTEFHFVMFLDADHFVTDATQLEQLLESGGEIGGGKKRKDVKKKKEEGGVEENAEKENENNSNNNNHFPANRLVAVGGHSYFQTGLMILKPNLNIFVDIYLEFRYGTFGYNQWRARDGILIRNCFLKSVDGINHPSGVFHFYGYFKPWFDVRRQRKITKEPISFDSMYLKWWERYEMLHQQLFVVMPISSSSSSSSSKGVVSVLYGGGNKARKQHLKEQHKRKFVCRSSYFSSSSSSSSFSSSSAHENENENEENNNNKIDPRCFMWLQRYRGNEEYLLPASEKIKNKWWDLSVKSLEYVVQQQTKTEKEEEKQQQQQETCNDICKSRHLVCRDDAFRWTSLSNCNSLKKILKEKIFSSSSSNSEKNQFCSTCEVRTDGNNLPIVNLGEQHQNDKNNQQNNNNKHHKNKATATSATAGSHCIIHQFLSTMSLPRCDTSAKKELGSNVWKRICPCVVKRFQNASATIV